MCDEFEKFFKECETLNTPDEINHFVLFVMSCHRDKMRTLNERSDVHSYENLQYDDSLYKKSNKDEVINPN